MRIVVILSRNDQEQERRTQYVSEKAIAGIVTGETDRSHLADVDMLLEPFSHLGDEITSSLAARLRVFVVPTSHHVALGSEHEGRARHAIVDGGIPKSIPADEKPVEDAIVATFVLDDVATVRHEIDPALVADSIERALVENARNGDRMRTGLRATQAAYDKAMAENRVWRGQIPKGEEVVDAYVRGSDDRQRNVYAKVRIIEMIGQARPEKPFFLVYGEEPDDATGSATGGFDTLDKAKTWFTRQGR